MIDFHCHIDLYPNPKEVVRECVARRLHVLSVTTTPSAWEGTSALISAAQGIRVALGLHPELAHERKSELALFDALVPEARYVGEIGLDGSPEFKRYFSDQTYVFEHILSRCEAAGGKIMTIHSRRAVPEVLDRLQTWHGAGIPILHWYSGSQRDLTRAIELGCWFSVGPAMLVAAWGRDLVARIPRDRAVSETDGPYADLNGRRLMPWHVETVPKECARVWGIREDEAIRQLDSNAAVLRGLAPSLS
jgi:TatD DNase family protein